jgi:hypothetical protein
VENDEFWALMEASTAVAGPTARVGGAEYDDGEAIAAEPVRRLVAPAPPGR